MLHNELIREFPCDGELVPVAELSSDWWTVTWCAKCGTEISWEPDSTWVHIVLPGMRTDVDV
jgi:hypothetical protein